MILKLSKNITCLHALNVKYYTYICMHSRQNTPEKKNTTQHQIITAI